jgi:serine protease Do
VGESPTVIDCRGQSLTARVLARDPDNDLVLLSVPRELPASIDLDSSADVAVGSLLLSPRPNDTLGLVSVTGSRPFRSPKQPSAGFLGVMLELRENRVAIRETIEGPARKAGLEPNDIVLKIGDKSIQTVPQMIATIQSYEPGEVVRLIIQRGEQEQNFNVPLDRRPDDSRGHVADLFAGGPSLRKTGFESVFCHDAHAEPQECGGPVFDLSGNFVGINVARFSRTRSYALPAQVVRNAVQRMQQQADREAISSDTKDAQETSDSAAPESSTAPAAQE